MYLMLSDCLVPLSSITIAFLNGLYCSGNYLYHLFQLLHKTFNDKGTVTLSTNATNQLAFDGNVFLGDTIRDFVSVIPKK